MDESEERQDEGRKELRCDPKQLSLLKKCSEEKDMTEWDKWRKENPDEEIWLQGANLDATNLEDINLMSAYLQRASFVDAHLENAYLEDASLEKADLMNAHLEGANLYRSYLEEASFLGAHLEGANLSLAHLENASLGGAYLDDASLSGTYLEGTHIFCARLKGANLGGTNLRSAILWGANLEGTDFTASIVDGSTPLWNCTVDRKTDFRGVGLDSCRMEEGTKHLLEYNKRRLNWEDWYGGESKDEWVRKKRQLLTSPVRLFWCMSDYGRSTIRILLVFLALAIVFAFVYWKMPACVIVNGQVGGLQDFLHALYFSVVTMTTLGFGDIAANPQSSCGQVLLMLQVFCGYFLLGAIVTRLSILFTAGGPAGRFSRRSNTKPKGDEQPTGA